MLNVRAITFVNKPSLVTGLHAANFGDLREQQQQQHAGLLSRQTAVTRSPFHCRIWDDYFSVFTASRAQQSTSSTVAAHKSRRQRKDPLYQVTGDTGQHPRNLHLFAAREYLKCEDSPVYRWLDSAVFDLRWSTQANHELSKRSAATENRWNATKFNVEPRTSPDAACAGRAEPVQTHSEARLHLAAPKQAPGTLSVVTDHTRAFWLERAQRAWTARPYEIVGWTIVLFVIRITFMSRLTINRSNLWKVNRAHPPMSCLVRMRLIQNIPSHSSWVCWADGLCCGTAWFEW